MLTSLPGVESSDAKVRQNPLFIGKSPTVSNTLPDVDATPSRIPDSTLAVQWPVNIELPNSCGVGDHGHRIC